MSQGPVSQGPEGEKLPVFIPYFAHIWNLKTSETKDRPDDACLTAVDPGPLSLQKCWARCSFLCVSLERIFSTPSVSSDLLKCRANTETCGAPAAWRCCERLPCQRCLGDMWRIADENCQRCRAIRLRIGEFFIPDNEPGSSIMSAKVNPTQCEAGSFRYMATRPRLRSVAARGAFELNVFKPVIIHNFLHSVRLLNDVSGSFLCHCLTGSNAGRRKLAVPTVRS
jgi:lyase family enzyme